jgi:acetyl-CoA carboxylase beta subunit
MMPVGGEGRYAARAVATTEHAAVDEALANGSAQISGRTAEALLGEFFLLVRPIVMASERVGTGSRTGDRTTDASGRRTGIGWDRASEGAVASQHMTKISQVVIAQRTSGLPSSVGLSQPTPAGVASSWDSAADGAAGLRRRFSSPRNRSVAGLGPDIDFEADEPGVPIAPTVGNCSGPYGDKSW